MKKETVKVSYIDGRRIAEERTTYEKSDDLFSLANLQRQYENILRMEAEAGGALPAAMATNKAMLEAQIAELEGYVAGYAESKVEA